MSESRLDRPMQGEIATARSDPRRWHYGGRIENEDPVLRSRGAAKGLDLYDEIERDPQVACELGKRRMALLGREWRVEAGADAERAERARALVERALKFCRLNQGVEKLLDALLKGVAVAEVMWTLRGGEILPAELRGRDPMRFRFALAAEPAAAPGEVPPPHELRLLTRAAPAEGEALPPRKFVLHRFGAKYEHPWGLGLGARLFWPVYFKRQGIGFWLSALEKFGQPTALGRYPPGTGQEEQEKLLAALTAIASEAGVIVPEGMAVELLEAKRAGSFESYERLARYMDEDISKVVLGQTLTASVGPSGSRALGEVHNEVRLELTKADADLLAETLNGTLVRWIVDLNDPGYAATGLPYPAIWWEVATSEDLTARAERDLKLRQLGYRPDPAYIRDTYGEGWEPETREVGADAAARALAAAFAEARTPRPGAAARDAADDLADQTEALAENVQERLIAALRGAIFAEEVTSLDQARERLLAILPGLPTPELAELLGRAFAVAHLAGRADQQDGR